MSHFDAAATGSTMKLATHLDKDPKKLNSRTHWLGNTCLHLAVKNQQLEAVKLIMSKELADPDTQNLKGTTPRMLCNQLKDKEVKKTMLGLLNKFSESTKVVRGTELRKEQRERN